MSILYRTESRQSVSAIADAGVIWPARILKVRLLKITAQRLPIIRFVS